VLVKVNIGSFGFELPSGGVNREANEIAIALNPILAKCRTTIICFV
jgi:hypothetical protein